MSDVVIRVEGVSKLYRLGEVGTGSLAHDVNRWWHKVRGKEDGRSLLIRWDNAPHHRHLSTFTYHKHLGEIITESLPISLAQVLDEIAQRVLKK
jgi:hypothetical protein